LVESWFGKRNRSDRQTGRCISAVLNCRKLADDTLRRYQPTLYSLSEFTEDRDVRQLRDVDIHDWATSRVAQGNLASTVNRNDLVAVNSVFNYMMSLNGGRLIQHSPTKGVKLRKMAKLDKDVDPNHFWRHTFKIIAQSHRARMEARWRDAITGHSVGSVCRAYEHPDIEDLVAAMAMYPRYGL
jgi:site-specific recombinase XerD